ncbi:hypothetical protein [Pandoraea anhela]|uniref:Uncharacterized protein n=1 Tax=Pandoraea anhela TaxID=2508295 RepID=A0A5E4TJG8_9BURK|nr:hypothetical protein [Pandoraea anhela]VVD88156.1 hypothetical protein PAN31108_01473 [Pandoraea anhela]
MQNIPPCSAANAAPVSLGDVTATATLPLVAGDFSGGANVSSSQGFEGDAPVVQSRSVYEESNTASVLSEADKNTLIDRWTNELKHQAAEGYDFQGDSLESCLTKTLRKYTGVFRDDIYEFVFAPRINDIRQSLRVVGLKSIFSSGDQGGLEILNRVWFGINGAFSEEQKQDVKVLLDEWKLDCLSDGIDPWAI